MIITSGYAKGHFLHEPKIKELNPAHEAVRKKLFDSLQDKLIGKKVLDLYAGTGSFGLESLSRGAATADFVDNSVVGIRSLRKNMLHTRFLGRVRVYCQSVVSFLASCTEKYDIIFVDPPNSSANLFELFEQLRRIAAGDNMVIIRGHCLSIFHPKVTTISEIKYAHEKIVVVSLDTKKPSFA